MKTLYAFIFVFFSLLNVKGHAQTPEDTLPTYIPMVVENNVWMIQCFLCIDLGPPGGPFDAIDYYYIRGDSVVNNTTYKKLKKCLAPGNHNPNVVGLLREDSAARKVYAMNLLGWGLYWSQAPVVQAPLNEEVLLYDFSLTAGDTMNFYWWNYDIAGDDAIIDSIFYINNPDWMGPHIRRSPRYGCGFMIEGEGSGDAGIFPAPNCSNYYSFSNMLFFREPLFCTPQWPLPLAELEKTGGGSLYPNPVSDVLSVEVPKGTSGYRFELIDYTGQTLQSGSIINELIALPVSDYPAGIYTIRLFQPEKGFTQNLTFIKR